MNPFTPLTRALALYCCIIPLLSLGGQFGKVPPPSWVEHRPIDPPQVEKRAEGTGAIYVDRLEKHLNLATDQEYFRIVKRLNTESGLQESSQITASFDPEYQNLAFHSLKIYRAGQIIDLLPTQKFRVIQREENHERQVYDNSRSCIALLEGTRVGDIVDYSYSVVGKNPVYESHFHWSLPTHYPFPIGHLSGSVRAPLGTEIHVHSRGEYRDPEMTREGSEVVYRWDYETPKEFILDLDLPADVEVANTVEISSTSSWKDIREWAQKNFPIITELPEELETIAKEIEETSTTDEEKALASLRFVQDQIRYLGIFEGVHSHRPHSLDVILQRRFGDCKDKSILLSALLQRLGVEAHPALVNTVNRGAIKSWLPSFGAFDHVVVQARIGSQDFWFDPTMTYQRGPIDQIAFPKYGYALPLRDGTSTLEPVAGNPQETNHMEIRERIDLPEWNGPAEITIESTYYGSLADSMRALFASISHNTLLRKLSEDYRSSHPDSRTLNPATFEDDEELNRFTIRETYSLPSLWEPIEDEPAILTYSIGSDGCIQRLQLPSDPDRDADFAISHPSSLKHDISFKTPESLEVDQETVEVDSPFFHHLYQGNQQGNTSLLSFEYQSKVDRIPADQIDAYAHDLNKALNLTAYTFNIPKGFMDGSVSHADYVALIENANKPPAEPLPTEIEAPTAPTEKIEDVNLGNALKNLKESSIVYIYGALAVGLLVGSILAFILSRRKKKPIFWQDYDSSLDGIGGWLIFFAIHHILAPLTLLVIAYGLTAGAEGLSSLAPRLNLDQEQKDFAIISMSSVLLICTFLLPLTLLLSVRFFRKHYDYPRLTTLVTIIHSLLIILMIGILSFDQTAGNTGRLWWMLISNALTIWYLRASKRVASTFRCHLPEEFTSLDPAPVQPPAEATIPGAPAGTAAPAGAPAGFGYAYSYETMAESTSEDEQLFGSSPSYGDEDEAAPATSPSATPSFFESAPAAHASPPPIPSSPKNENGAEDSAPSAAFISTSETKFTS